MSRLPLFLAFFGVLLTLFGLMQWRLYRAFRSWVRSSFSPEQQRRWLRAGFWTILAGNAIFLLRIPFGEVGRYDHWLVQGLVIYPGALFFGAIVLGFLVVAVRDLFRLIRGLVGKAFRPLPEAKAMHAVEEPVDEGRRKFLRTAGIVTVTSIGALPAISSAATARDYRINRLVLTSPRFPSSMNGMTVAQISDIHSGMFMTEADMREIFEIVQRLRADLIVMTGDQVDNAVSQLPPLHRALGMLKAEHGVYACLGNHDHYADASAVAAGLRDRGINLLTNEHRVLTIGGDRIVIAGVDDAKGGLSDGDRLAKALKGIDSETYTLLLTHRPSVFRSAHKLPVDLTLAGHTHGGQVGIEFYGINLNPVYLVHEYARGLYTERDRHLYVNVGVGMVGVPIRLVRPEISLFTLRSGPLGAAEA